MFYVAPLFLIALLVWIERGVPASATGDGDRRRRRGGPARSSLPYQDFIGLNAVSDTLRCSRSAGSWSAVSRSTTSTSSSSPGASSRALPSSSCRAATRSCCPALVLAYFAVSQQPIVAEHRFRAAQHLFGGHHEPPPRLDRPRRRAERGRRGLSGPGTSDKFTVWENEFFNRSVGTIYDDGPGRAGRPRRRRRSPSTAARASAPRRRHAGALAVRPHGRVARAGRAAGRGGHEEADAPLPRARPAAAARVRHGPLPAGHLVGQARRLRAARLPGGTLAVGLQSDPALFLKPNGVVARIGGRVVRARRGRSRREQDDPAIPLQPNGGTCTVRFTVAPDRRAAGRHRRGEPRPAAARPPLHLRATAP